MLVCFSGERSRGECEEALLAGPCTDGFDLVGFKFSPVVETLDQTRRFAHNAGSKNTRQTTRMYTKAVAEYNVFSNMGNLWYSCSSGKREHTAYLTHLLTQGQGSTRSSSDR